MTAQIGHGLAQALYVAQCYYYYPLLPTLHCANCGHHSDTVVTHFCPTSSVKWTSGAVEQWSSGLAVVRGQGQESLHRLRVVARSKVFLVN